MGGFFKKLLGGGNVPEYKPPAPPAEQPQGTQDNVMDLKNGGERRRKAMGKRALMVNPNATSGNGVNV